MPFQTQHWFRSALGLALLLASPCFAQPVVDAGRAPDSQATQLAQTLRTAIAGQALPTSSVNLRITVGADALREALDADPSQLTLALYLSSVEFDVVLKDRKRSTNVTAIFNNPDPLDQVYLAESLLGKATLGVFDSPNSHSLAVRLTHQSVQVISAQPEQDIDSLLRRASGINALIVLPDSAVLNRANINHVVRTLYQQRSVLIGYSQTLTQVGSLASIYVTPNALLAQILKTVTAVAENGALPAPRFVSDVSVAVNEQLARSLNIPLPPDATLLDAIKTRRKEQTP